MYIFVSGDVICADLETLAECDVDTEADIEPVVVGVLDNNAV